MFGGAGAIHGFLPSQPSHHREGDAAKDLAEAADARIRTTLHPDSIVIFAVRLVQAVEQPGWPANPTDGERCRHGSGAAAGSPTTIRDGRECGAAYGANKENVYYDASTLVNERIARGRAAQATRCGVLSRLVISCSILLSQTRGVCFWALPDGTSGPLRVSQRNI